MATKSSTVSCRKCCGLDAECSFCGYESEAAGCTEPDTVAISKTMTAGSECDGAIFKEDTECYECKKCNRDNYSWVPDVSTRCEGEMFLQTRQGDYPECKMTQEAYGTKDCSATCGVCGFEETSLMCSSGQAAIPRTVQAGSICNGKTVASDLECYECVNCNYQNFPWTPFPSDVCEGVAFEQTKTGQYPSCVVRRTNYGTKKDCDSGEASCSDCYGLQAFSQCPSGQAAVSRPMSSGSSCNQKTFSEDTECYECVNCNYQNFPWTPLPSTVCKGVAFEQTKTGQHPNCIIKQIAYGTKIPVPGAWAPSCQSSDYCAGTTGRCTQYRDDGCGNTLTQTINVAGTKTDGPCWRGNCSWRIIETGYGTVFSSGGPGTRPPTSFTPPTHNYTGYMSLQYDCGSGWKTDQSWTTINGGPTRRL